MTLSRLLHGKQVRLAALRPDDAVQVARWQEDGEFLRLFDARAAFPSRQAQLARQFEDTERATDAFHFGIRLQSDDALIGLLSVDEIVWPHRTGWLSLGIGEKAAQGKGYGSESLSLALQFAFDELNLYRLQLTVFSYNTPAIRLYERHGFTLEGRFREFLQRDGQRYDMLLYGLLVQEWPGTSKSSSA